MCGLHYVSNLDFEQTYTLYSIWLLFIWKANIPQILNIYLIIKKPEDLK